VGRPDRKKPFGKPRNRWVENTRRDLKPIGWKDRDGINLAADRDKLSNCEHGNEL